LGIVGWKRIILRNQLFQRKALSVLRKKTKYSENNILFAYSYAARSLFEMARSRGIRTLLGQTDAGPASDRIIADLHASETGSSRVWRTAPSSYWSAWRRECELADRIIVNSAWSREALSSAGIPKDKISIVPLAYAPPPEASTFVRDYPERFTRARPLRVLFLGQVVIGKGVRESIAAMHRLENSPVELWIVGPNPGEIRESQADNINWVGRVHRSRVSQFYRDADVFLFPTHTDGFGLTQLEAQAWKLPVLSSRFCGNVVADGCNGLLIDPVNCEQIERALRQILARPSCLAEMSRRSVDMTRYSFATLGSDLESVQEEFY
jgi:glycosyltransferase involved in cell wall biosynthesis